MSRILIVEDEQHLASGLRFNLEAEGHEVEIIEDGESALQRLLPEDAGIDAVVLDVMLPGQDGFHVAAELRKAGRFVPILMLTAMDRPEDVLKGFAAGADDYLPKPFELKILLARIHGLLRRKQWLAAANGQQKNGSDIKEFTFGNRTIDFEALQLRVGKEVHQLTAMEAELLRYFVKNAGKVIPRKDILEEVWGLHVDTDTRAIDNFIARLRKYVEKDSARPKFLLTVRGVGYRFEPGE